MMIRTRALLAVALAVSVVGTAATAQVARAQTVDSFQIAYGDNVSDGVPGPGAGNIEVGGGADSYSFEAQAGDVAIFDVLSGTASVFSWKLESPAGQVVFDSFFVDRSQELSETGTYLLTVYGTFPASTGTYSFRLLLTPPPQQFSIAFADTVSDGVPGPGAGNIEGPGEVDRYLFEGTAGQVAVVDRLSGPASGLRLTLHAPGGAELVNMIYADTEVLLPETGTYTLTLAGLTINSAGPYSFQLIEAPVQVDEFTIDFGDTVSDGVPGPGAGNIEAPGAIDRYFFDASAGQVAIFDRLTGPASGLSWSLHAPDGTRLFDIIYRDTDLVLPQTGTYTLDVRGLTVTGIGVYSFQLLTEEANRPPVAVDDEAETDHGMAVIIDVLANDSDPDGDPLTIVAVSRPLNGTVVITGDQLTYTPDTGFSGTDMFTYTVSDGRGGSAEAEVTVTVHEPPNHPPTIEPIPDQEHTVGDDVNLSVQADDPDGDQLFYTADGLPAGLDIDTDTGEITGIIEDGAEVDSPYDIEVTVTDPDGASATTGFRWTIHGPGDPLPVPVEIDIVKPCFFVNGFGVIPVVVYGNDRFDGADVDPATVRLEGMGVQKILIWYAAVVADYNGDGIGDLFVLIKEKAGAIPAGATSATLTANLKDGTPVEGSDDICVLPDRLK